jgi:hypothetical protein
MPLPKARQDKPQATARDVKSAAGDAAFAYFKKHGSFPTSKEQLAKG